MKRRKPLKRTPFERKRKPLRRKARPSTTRERDQREWGEGLRSCIVCPIEGLACSGPLDPHHVISKRALKRRGFDFLLWDKRNRIAVCRRRHDLHEKRTRPIPFRALPPAAIEFAGELDLVWMLERDYA